MRRVFVLSLLVALVGLATVAGAQTLTGTISGKVTDQQGGVLPGVAVTLTGKTGAQTQTTDAKGEFRFMGLAPGTYAVKAELQGFRPKEQQALDVTMGKTIELSLPMTVGGLSETIDVVANAITIDTTSTKTDTNMGQDLLFSMPLSHNNPAVSILQYSPGVNDGSAFGGSSDSGNSLMLDGVDTRDPEGGTAWTFYNYNIIQEVQVGSLGQPAELGGFTGAVVNTITKSGGNRFSSLAEWRFSNDSLGSNNLGATTGPILSKNPTIFPASIVSYNDYTVQLGGPIAKDKIFFFASIQRYKIEQYVSRPLRGEVSPRFNLKFTFQPTSNDSIIGSLQYDQYNQKGRTAFIPGYAVSNNNQTVNQDSPEYIYNAQYRKVFNSSTFLEAKYMGWWGYYYLNPVTPDIAHYDAATNQYSGGAGYTYLADRTRNQVNVSLSKYASLAGQHNFKFGVEIERSMIHDRFQYSGASAAAPTGVYFYDSGGPYMAYGYSYNLKGHNQRESFYAQDQWKMGRLTLNLGLRADKIGGSDDATGNKLYSTFSVGPRLGAAFDLTGKGTSVLRGYYGQLYDSAVFSSWSRATNGLTPFFSYEVGPNWSTLAQVDATQKVYTTGDNLKHPRVDEMNVAWEQQIGRSFKFTATGIYRSWKNFLNSALTGANWTQVPYTPVAWPTGAQYGPAPFTPTALTLYKLTNGTNTPGFLIQNTDTITYQVDGQTITPKSDRTYKGLMLVFQRAYKNRWQAQVSYVLSKTEGTVSNSQSAGIASGQFETPNTILVNADGPTAFDRRHEVKIFAGYQIPVVEVNLSGYWRYLSGYPYVPYARVRAGSGLGVNWTSYINTNLVASGANPNFMTESETSTDLRLEKVFNLGIHRIGVYADIQNVFNEATILSVQTRYPDRTLSYHDPASSDPNSITDVKVPFGAPLTVSAGRQVTLGFRWSF
jgi:hypothetical protein